MKLFNIASEVGQHPIDRDCSKDTFGNMQAGPVTVSSKKENDGIHEKMRNQFHLFVVATTMCQLLASTYMGQSHFVRARWD
jgi:hypothetical protein